MSLIWACFSPLRGSLSSGLVSLTLVRGSDALCGARFSPFCVRLPPWHFVLRFWGLVFPCGWMFFAVLCKPGPGLRQLVPGLFRFGGDLSWGGPEAIRGGRLHGDFWRALLDCERGVLVSFSPGPVNLVEPGLFGEPLLVGSKPGFDHDAGPKNKEAKVDEGVDIGQAG